MWAMQGEPAGDEDVYIGLHLICCVICIMHQPKPISGLDETDDQ